MGVDDFLAVLAQKIKIKISGIFSDFVFTNLCEMPIIKRSNMDPYKIFPKLIIVKIVIRVADFDSTKKLIRRLERTRNREINRDSTNFDYDLLSKCDKEIINSDHRSIKFDKDLFFLIIFMKYQLLLNN